MKVEVILVVIGVWNLTLSYLLWRIAREFRQLTEGLDKDNLEELLDGLDGVKKRLKQLDQSNKFCFQKASLVKFNPFAELGGEQSFSLALLDEEDRGVVITSLHGRQATRVYTKLVGDDKVRLSKEEERAIKKATKSKR